MDRVFLSQENIEIVFKFVQKGFLQYTGRHLHTIGEINGIKNSIIKVMKNIYRNNPKPLNINRDSYLFSLNEKSIKDSINKIMSAISQLPHQPNNYPQQQPRQPNNYPQQPIYNPQQQPPINFNPQQPFNYNPQQEQPINYNPQEQPFNYNDEEIDENKYDLINAEKKDLNNIYQRMQSDRTETINPKETDFVKLEKERIRRMAPKKTNEKIDVSHALNSLMENNSSESSDNDDFFDNFKQDKRNEKIEKEQKTILNLSNKEKSTLRNPMTISKVKIVSLQVPKSQYNIHKYNNVFQWKDSDSEVKKIEVIPGNYNIKQLIDFLSEKLNSGKSKFKITLDEITEKITISAESNFQKFELLFDLPNSIGKLLGFQLITFTNKLSYSSENRYNILEDYIVYLKIDELSPEYLLQIPLKDKINFLSEPFTFQPDLPVNVNSLNIQFLTPSGKPYQFEAHDWYMTLELFK